MANDDEVLIKVAADIASALEGLTTLTAQMGEVVKQITDVGKESEESESATKSFWETWVSGAEGGTTASVAWGLQISQAFDTLKEGVGNAIKALPQMVAHSAEVGDQLFTMSNRLNVAVGALGELQYISDQSGASFEGMARTIQTLGVALADATGGPAKAIERLGLSVAQLKTLKPEEQFFTILQAIKQTVPVADQGAKAIEVFGGKFRNMTMLLKEDIGGLREAYAKLGMSAEDLEKLAIAGDEYSDNINDIKLVQESWKNQISLALLPAINDVLKAMPQLGGAVLVAGEAMGGFVESVVPLVANFATINSGFDKLFPSIGKFALAAGEATGATKFLSEGLGSVGKSLGALSVVVGAAILIWEAYKGATAETGWLRELSDSFEYASLRLQGFSEAEADSMIATDHATQKQLEAAEAAKKAGKANEDGAKSALSAADGYAQLAAATAKAKADLAAIEPAQRAVIAAAIAQGTSLKDISESTHVSVAALELFKTQLSDIKKAADDSPFAKLMKQTKELAIGIKEATAAGAPMADVMAEFGKQSADAVGKAMLVKDGLAKIPPEVRKIGQAFAEADLAKKLETIGEKAKELQTSFSAKMTAGAKGASDAIKSMQDEMLLNFLSASDQKLARIDMERKKAIEGVKDLKDALLKSLADEEKALSKTFADQRKAVTETIGLSKEVKDAKIANINEAEARALEAARNEAAGVAEQYDQQTDEMTAFYKQKKDLQTGDTGNFEADMKARGITTQKVVNDALAVEQKKLKDLKALHDPFYQEQIEKQEEVVKRAEASAGSDLATQKKHLADMKSGRIVATAEQIADHQKMVDSLIVVSDKEASEELKIQRTKLQEMKGDRATNTREEIAAQQEIVDKAASAAGKTKTEWGGALDSINTAFTQLATIAGGSFGGVLKTMGEVTGQMGVMKSGFKGAFDAFSGAGKSGGFKGIGESFKSAGSGMGGMLKGLTKGLGTVMPMVGGIIAGVTAAIAVGKKVFDLFNKSAGEKAAKEVGKNFGVKITEEAGNAIAKTAKDMFKGDRFAASIYEMNSIIKTAGGINEKNFKTMADRMHDVFSMVQTGKFTVEQATKVLNENFGAFADYVTKSGKVASKQFTDLIRLNKEFGTNSKEIMDFVGAQTSRLGGALAKMAGSMDDNAESVARFERLAVAGFNSAIAAGVPYLDAIDQMGPALDKINEKNKKLGLSGGAAIQELLRFREVAEANKDLVESAGALNEVMLALSNTGALNAETMADLQAQGQSTFSQLTAAGFTEQQALQQMKGYLEQVRNAHEELGLPIDSNTQALLDQAESTGVVKAKQMEATDVMMTGFSAIIKALGGEIPAAFQKMATSATTSAQQVVSSVQGVGTSVAGVQKNLDGTDWKGWAADGNAAAASVEQSVTGVAEGESPGGIFGIIKRLKQSIGHFKDFAAAGLHAAGSIGDLLKGDVAGAFDKLKGAAIDSTKAIAGAFKDSVGVALDATKLGIDAATGNFSKMTGTAVESATAVAGSLNAVAGSLNTELMPAIDQTTEKLNATPWTEMAQRAVDAAGVMTSSVTGIGTSVAGVQKNLDGTDWTGWAAEGNAAAASVEESVTGVAEGESPGGIFGIIKRLKESMGHFKDFAAAGIHAAGSVVNVLKGDIPGAFEKIKEATKDSAAALGGEFKNSIGLAADSFKVMADAGVTAATKVAGAVDATLGTSLEKTHESLLKGGGLWDLFRDKGIVAATDSGVAVAGQLNPTLDESSEKLNATPWDDMAKRASDAAGAVGGAVTDKMGGAILAAHDKMRSTPWTEFAQKGIAAGTVSANAIKGVQTAIGGAANELGSADWSGWANELASAAHAAQDAVDAVSLGSSPGGLIEIPKRIKEAMKSFKAFEDMGVGSAENVRESVDALSGAQANIGVAGGVAAAAGVAAAPVAGGGGGETFNITIQALDSAGVEGITETKVIPAIVKALRKGGRNLTDIQGVIQ